MYRFGCVLGEAAACSEFPFPRSLALCSDVAGDSREGIDRGDPNVKFGMEFHIDGLCTGELNACGVCADSGTGGDTCIISDMEFVNASSWVKMPKSGTPWASDNTAWEAVVVTPFPRNGC